MIKIDTQMYHYFRERIPFIIALVYYIFKNRQDKYTNLFVFQWIVLTGVALSFVITNIIKNNPFKDIGLKWSHYAALEWCLYILTSFAYTNRVTKDRLYSLNYAAQSASSGGLIYEIPLFITKQEGSLLGYNNLFFLKFQLISILIMAYVLYEKKFKLNKKIIATIIIYLVYSTISIYNIRFFKHTRIFQRIPTMIMFISFISGIIK